MITFQLKGDKHVVKQIGNHVTLFRPLKTDRHSIPLWNNGRVGKHADVTRLQCERFEGDFDVVFLASPDVELSIDYQKGNDTIGFYHHKGIRAIGLFEHDTNTLITQVKIAKGNKRPITFDLADLAYLRGDGVGEIYYQNFGERWQKAFAYASDFKLPALQIDCGDLSETVTDHYNCNITNRGEGLDQFDFNLTQASLAAVPSADPDPTESESEQSDTTSPQIGISSSRSSLGAGETAVLTFTLTEAASDFSSADVTVSGGALSDFTVLSAVSYTALFTPAAESTTTAAVIVPAGSFSDGAGNSNATGVQLTIAVDTTTSAPADTTAPTSAISSSSSSLGVGETATLTISISEVVSNFTASDLSATGGSLSGFTTLSGSSYSVVFTPAANSTTNGVIAIADGSFTDSAGNSGIGSSITLTVDTTTQEADTTAPTAALASSRSSLGIGQTAQITVTLSEASTNFSSADLVATGGVLSNFSAVSSTSYTALFTPAADSSTDAVITTPAGSFTDAAGNANTQAASLTLTVDTTVSTTTYVVTVVNVNLGYGNTGNRYYIDGVRQPTLSLSEGQTYRFDQSNSTNSTHPLRLSTTANGTHAGGVEYTTGVSKVGTAGSSGAYTEITVPIGAPTLYYYCANHSAMGGAANT